MKKEKTSKARHQADDEMRPEYDFRGGVRGKHYQAYRRGHTGHDSQDRWLESGAALHTRRWRGHVRARRASLFPRLRVSEQRLTLPDSLAATKTQSKSESLTLWQEFRCYE